MPRVTLKTLFVVVAVVVAGYQLSAVTLAALPPNRYSDATASRTAYLSPFFGQNWRLFAPNPVAEDRDVLFQGSWTGADGTQHRTPWIDWTAVELDLVRHRLVGNRAGYVTNKMTDSLSARFNAFDDEQRRSVATTSEKDPPTWRELDTLLADKDAAVPDTIAYLRYERATSRLATDVLEGRYPGRTFTAVRYAVRLHSVVPYAARNESKAAREAARPAATQRDSGWRVPTPGPASERRAVADFDRRHR